MLYQQLLNFHSYCARYWLFTLNRRAEKITCVIFLRLFVQVSIPYTRMD